MKRPIDSEIANDRKLRERLQADRLVKLVNQGGAGHPGAAIDQHGARAADFLQAIGVISDRCSRRALSRDRIGGDLHQRGDHVHAWFPGKLEFFPERLGFRCGLSLDLETNLLFVIRHGSL